MPVDPFALTTHFSQPPAEDYDSIYATVMETARGRWFLDEYARRNRNADTTLLLAAMRRLESALAIQNAIPVSNHDAGADIAPALFARHVKDSVAPLTHQLQELRDALLLTKASLPKINSSGRKAAVDQDYKRIATGISVISARMRWIAEQVSPKQRKGISTIYEDLDKLSEGATLIASLLEEVETRIGGLIETVQAYADAQAAEAVLTAEAARAETAAVQAEPTADAPRPAVAMPHVSDMDAMLPRVSPIQSAAEPVAPQMAAPEAAPSVEVRPIELPAAASVKPATPAAPPPDMRWLETLAPPITGGARKPNSAVTSPVHFEFTVEPRQELQQEPQHEPQPVIAMPNPAQREAEVADVSPAHNPVAAMPPAIEPPSLPVAEIVAAAPTVEAIVSAVEVIETPAAAIVEQITVEIEQVAAAVEPVPAPAIETPVAIEPIVLAPVLEAEAAIADAIEPVIAPPVLETEAATIDAVELAAAVVAEPLVAPQIELPPVAAIASPPKAPEIPIAELIQRLVQETVVETIKESIEQAMTRVPVIAPEPAPVPEPAPAASTPDIAPPPSPLFAPVTVTHTLATTWQVLPSAPTSPVLTPVTHIVAPSSHHDEPRDDASAFAFDPFSYGWSLDQPAVHADEPAPKEILQAEPLVEAKLPVEADVPVEAKLPEPLVEATQPEAPAPAPEPEPVMAEPPKPVSTVVRFAPPPPPPIPAARPNGPLAAIMALSDEEKIALFS